MLNMKSLGVATLGMVAAGLGMGAATPANAATIWSWSFGTSSNGATGTFATTDVADSSKPFGTYDVLQFTLSTINGVARSATATNLWSSPKFNYFSATNYGFENNLWDAGFRDSNRQNWDSPDWGMIHLSGSAEYEAGLPGGLYGLQRRNLVEINGLVAADGLDGLAWPEHVPGDLTVRLSLPDSGNDPASTPEPGVLLALAGASLGAAILKRKTATA